MCIRDRSCMVLHTDIFIKSSNRFIWSLESDVVKDAYFLNRSVLNNKRVDLKFKADSALNDLI